jgi:hypothetical protein
MAGKRWSRSRGLPPKAIDISFWANSMAAVNVDVNAVTRFLGTVREDA